MSTSTNEVLDQSPACVAHDTQSMVLEHAPFKPEAVVSGPVTTGCIDLGETASLKCGVWEHNVGVSMQENDDEVFVVLAGRGRIVFDDGTPDMLLAPGVVGRLLAGRGRRWEVTEAFRKVWIVTRDANCL